MDILSDVISAVRAGTPGGERVEWRAPWRQHFQDQPGTAGFLVVLRGTCWLIGDAAEPARLVPGDVVFSPHGDGYVLADTPAGTVVGDEVAASSPTTVTLCGGYQLTPEWTHPLLRELPGTIHIPAHPGHYPGLRAAVEVLGAELGSERPGAAALLPVALDMLLLYVLRAWFEKHPREETPTGWAAALADPDISAALNAMHDDPAHRWTVQELADKAQLSRATFSRRFNALTGQPPLTYLTWWRMTTAARLLLEPASSMDAVATRIGYTSEFAFANAFKRHFQLAPGKYRRQAQALARR
ncbi:AraC family transcriptional regulator [Streptomyces johnsoniae]|uniref:AraC family transcriptional regulator n=1 Tax=Streptomyces johnsoniae TaxID=3075532 RepID=A0ABU2S9I1_9ACTN|nr:AraC family transcriptional regulator [Streptomyces sp. DSM 41886]MDT0445336.1 AraC family transcriptional regulator [Streptomyces sp. DSM 41886]